MSSFYRDLKHSVHMFLENPGSTLSAIAAVALGIGANTAIFSAVDTVLLKPLSYADSERIVCFESTFPDGSNTVALVTKFHLWQEYAKVFQNVAAYDFTGIDLNLTGVVPEQIHGVHVTAITSAFLERRWPWTARSQQRRTGRTQGE
jgi:putative ABC transport system permease protein